CGSGARRGAERGARRRARGDASAACADRDGDRPRHGVCARGCGAAVLHGDGGVARRTLSRDSSPVLRTGEEIPTAIDEDKMTAQSGKDMLLKLDQTGAGGFVTVAGLRTRSLSFNAAAIDVTDAESAGRWRELLAGGGSKRGSVSGRRGR